MNVAQGYAAGFLQWRSFILYGAGLVTAGFFVFRFQTCRHAGVSCSPKAEATAAPGCYQGLPLAVTEVLKPPPAVEIGPLSQEEDCFMQSKGLHIFCSR